MSRKRSKRSSTPISPSARPAKSLYRPTAGSVPSLSRRRSMPLIRNDAFVEDDWTFIGNEDPLPDSGDIAVTFARLLKDWETLTRHDGRLGVVFANAERAEALTLF